MKYNKVSRRMFLQGSGSTVLTIPFLSSLLPKEAWAQSTVAPKRMISIFTGLDYGHHSAWLPGGAANITNIPQPNRTFSPGGGHHDIRWQPLREFAPTGSSPLARLYGTTLSPYLESINIMRSLDYLEYRGHDSARNLGGSRLYSQNDAFGANWKPIPTIDNVINANRTFNPAGLPLIFGGTNEGPGGNSWSYAPSGANSVNVLEPVDSLLGLYNALFRSGSFPETGSSTPTHPRRDILTNVIDDFRRVMGSRNISAVDKTTLSNAMDKLSDVQRGLAVGSTGQCSHKGLSRSLDMYQVGFIPANGKAMADMITAAIMCDSARMFTFGITGGDVMYQRSPVPNVDLHQNISHTPFATYGGLQAWQHMADLQANYYRNMIAPLIQGLSAAIDPANGKSYLYNSLLYSAPAAGQTHGHASQPVILAGNAGGALTSGNYIDYANRARGTLQGCDTMNGSLGNAQFSNNWYGIPYNRLMVTMLQAMGLAPAAYEDNTLNSQVKNVTDIGSQNANLTSVGGWGYVSSADFRGRSGYIPDEAKFHIKNYDLRFYKDKLPIPA